MDFKAWLLEEGRFDNRFNTTYMDRVNFGKSIEDEIFNQLRANGLNLEKPTENQDKFSKIDAWLIQKGQRIPMQIKYRDTGDDILFEVMKDYNKQVPGRDMVGKSVLYAVLSRNGGIIRIVKVKDAKALIEMMVNRVQTGGWPDERMSFKMPVAGGVAFLKVRPDPATGKEKLMAYIPVSALPVVFSCNANISLDK